MIHRDRILCWLRDQIKLSPKKVLTAGIFGSIARSKVNPRDCDLLIVIRRFESCSDWKSFRDWHRQTSRKFLKRWKIPLEIVVMTEAEFAEKSRFLNKTFSEGFQTLGEVEDFLDDNLAKKCVSSKI